MFTRWLAGGQAEALHFFPALAEVGLNGNWFTMMAVFRS